MTLDDATRTLASDRTNNKAWKVVYEALWPLLVAHAYRILRGDGAGAEDVAQHVFSRLIRGAPLEKFSQARDLRAYAMRVATNAAIDRVRSARIVASEPLPEPQYLGNVEHDALELRELIESLEHELDDVNLRLLVMVIEGHALPHIANELGLEYSAAGVRLHRLRHALQSHLAHRTRKNA